MGSSAGPGGGRVEPVENAVGRYVDWLAETYGGGVRGDRPVLVSTARTAQPRPPRRSSPRGWASTLRFIGAEPDGRNINAGVGSTHLDALARAVQDARRRLRARVRRRRRPLPGGRRRAAGPSTATRSSRRCDRPPPPRPAGRRPGGRHVDDQPRVPPAHARARDRRRGDRRRRPLRARADARDRRDARRRAVRPRGRPRAPHDRRRACDRAHAARRARPARAVDGRASSTSCSRSRRSSSAVPADRAALDGLATGSGRRSGGRGEARGGRPRGAPGVGHRAGGAGHGRGAGCGRVRTAVRPSCRESSPPRSEGLPDVRDRRIRRGAALQGAPPAQGSSGSSTAATTRPASA